MPFLANWVSKSANIIKNNAEFYDDFETVEKNAKIC